MNTAGLEVLAAGALTTVQDAGRPGHAHEGVPPSGAADARSYALANRLVGNPAGEAALEVTLGGLRVRLAGGAIRHMAVAGAPAPLVVDGRPVPVLAPVAVRPGQVVELGLPPAGLRSYLAVAGGVDVAPELGSRSADVLSGLGPPPLQAGDVLPLGAPGPPPPAVDAAPPPAMPATVELLAGPRDDWLTDASWNALAAAAWTVSADSNRVGVRLAGPTLEIARRGELPPEGIVTGAVQVPPSGQPVVFLTDHPVTGGYPVVAVVDDDGLSVVAQARPGATLRLAVQRRAAR